MGKSPVSTSSKRNRRKTAPWFHRGIRIRPLKGRKGNYASFRVEVPESITGQRILKQFKTSDEAEAYAEKMFVQRQNSGLVSFLLTDAQRTDAMEAINLLSVAGCTITLKDAAQHYIKHARPEAGDISTEDLRTLYQDTKKNKGLRPRSVSDLKHRLNVFCQTFGKRLVKDLKPQEIEDWLFGDPSWSAQTRRNFRTVLMGFFNFALAKKYVAENPIVSITNPVVEDCCPNILTIQQAWALLGAAREEADLELLPYVAIGLFCGVRSAELTKLDWSHVDLKRGHVTISPEIAKKRRIRVIDMPKCCRTWLETVEPKTTGLISPGGHGRRWAKLLAVADRYQVDRHGKRVDSQKPHGLIPWPANALRHSAASYHYARHGDAAKTCAMLGQRDDKVLFDHYRALVTPADAKAFYSLLPTTPAGKIIKLAAS